MQLRLSNRMIQGVTIVDCHGRILFGDETALLREAVKTLLPESRMIVLNLKDVTYVDSGGLGTLVGVFTSAHKLGCEVKLACLTPRVGQLLQMTKLLTVFDVHENEEAAVRSFARTTAAT